MVREQYAIRQLTYNNATGDAYGITIPKTLKESFSSVSFKIQNGSILLSEQNYLIENINIAFKELIKELPGESYNTLKRHQLELRGKVDDTFNELKHSIILRSGCKAIAI